MRDGLEKVADGVWLLRGDFRGAMNIYFLEDGDGVVQFDAGTKGMRKQARAAGERARRGQAGRARPRPRRPPRHRSLHGGAGLLPPRRGRRRRKRRRDRPLLGPLAAAGGPGALDLPDPAAALGRRRGEDRRHRRRGRRGRRLPGHPLPRPRAGADRALARERPGGAGQRRRLPGRLGAAETAARGRGERPPPRLGLGPRARRRSRCASWRRWNRRWSAPATRSRCAARTCARRWSGRPRSTERGGAPPARCHSFRA